MSEEKESDEEERQLMVQHVDAASPTCFGTSVARERADIRILLFLLKREHFMVQL